MAQNVRIRGNDWVGVPAIKIPKADGSGNEAVFPDTSGDSVTAAHLESGYTAHGADGNLINGELVPGGITPSGNKEITQQTGTDVTNYATASVRSASTTVSAAKSVSNHTATVTPSVAVGTSGWIGNGASGTPVTVSPADLGAVVPSGNKAITSTAQVDVSGYATAQVSDANLTAVNIASGKTILGIAGTHAGAKPEQTKSPPDYTANGTYNVTPDSGYVLSKVTVTVAIPYYEGW